MLRLLVVLALMTRIAHADAQANEDKSRAVAVSLSVGVTLAGVAALFAPNDGVKVLGVGAMFIGPSTGRWYAGDGSAAGLGYRALGLGVAVLGVTYSVTHGCEAEADIECNEGFNGPGAFFAVAGAGLWVGSTVIDVVLADRAARRWNERHALSIAPMRIGTGDGRTTGLALSGQF